MKPSSAGSYNVFNLATAAQLLAAASGLFLVAAYVAGRLYLAAYFRAFNVSFSDLQVSVHDIMFASWRPCLSAILSVIAVGLLIAWASSRNAVIGRILSDYPAIKQLRDELVKRAEAVNARLRRVGEPADAGDQSPQVRREMLDIFSEQQAILAELRALETQLDLIESDLDIVESSRLRAVWRWLEPKTTLVWASLIALFLALGAFLVWHGGWKSGLLATADAGLAGLAVYAIILLGRPIIFSNEWSSIKKIGATGAVILILTLPLPFVSGLLDGHSSRSHKDHPGTGLPMVVLTAEHALAEDWIQRDGEFASPQLRLIAQGPDFIITWDPMPPNTTTYIPTSQVRRVERQ